MKDFGIPPGITIKLDKIHELVNQYFSVHSQCTECINSEHLQSIYTMNV